MKINPDALKGNLKNLAPCYLIHGEEDLLRLESLNLLRKTAKAQGYQQHVVLHSDDTAFDWAALGAMAATTSLFSALKLLELHIPNGKPGRVGADALSNLAKKLPSDTVVVIFLPKLDRTQTQSRWFKALTAIAIEIEARAIDTQALPQWLRKRLNRYQLTIDDDALALFAEKVEGHLLAAHQEIEKLALLYPDGKHLNLADAQNAVANVARFDVFQLAQSWMMADTPRLLRLLDALAAQDDSPILLLWALSEDIRMLLRLKAALAAGQSIHSQRQALRLWGDKPTWANLAANRLTVRQLLDALQQCARADGQIKGIYSGDPWQTVRTLLLALALPKMTTLMADDF